MLRYGSHFHLLKLFHICCEHLEDKGLNLEAVTDPAEVVSVHKAINKTSTTHFFSNDINDFTRGNSTWTVLSGGNGPIGVVAAKLIELGGEGFGEYLTRKYSQFYGPIAVDLFAANAMSKVSGRVAYAGEFFIDKPERGSRTNLTALAHAHFAYCFSLWQPDWIVAFIRSQDVRSGYAAEYGFIHALPGASVWASEPVGRSNGEYFVTIPKGEFFDAARYYSAYPEFLFTKDVLGSPE